MAALTGLIVVLVVLSVVGGEMTEIGRTLYAGHFINIYEDVNSPGRYYVSPIAQLNMTALKCHKNIITNVNELRLQINIWTSDVKNDVYRFILNHPNYTAHYDWIELLPMDRLRLRWKKGSMHPVDDFKLVEDWVSAHSSPSKVHFSVMCTTTENCTSFRDAIILDPLNLNGLEMEYLPRNNVKKSVIALTTQHFFSAPLTKNLTDLPPWPRRSDYRYLQPRDRDRLVDQVVRQFLHGIPVGSQYDYLDSKNDLKAQLTRKITGPLVSIDRLPVAAWTSVLWLPSHSRPDRMAAYLNSVLSRGTGSNSGSFLIELQQRSADSEGVNNLSTKTFFGVPITATNLSLSGSSNTTAYERGVVSKDRILSYVRKNYPNILFTGLRFTIKQMKMYRISLESIRAERIMAVLSLAESDESTRSVLVKPAERLISTDFETQSQIVNLTEMYKSTQDKLQLMTEAFNNLTNRYDTLTNKTAYNHTELMKKYEYLSKNGSSAVFTRWGRTVCPSGSDIVYKGYMVSGDESKTGGLGEYVCLNDDPNYFVDRNNALRTASSGAYIYRTEMYGSTSYSGYLTTNTGGQSHSYKDAVCVVCRRPGKSSSVVVWGRNDCPGSDWTLEYNGFFSSEYPDVKLSTSAVCMDEAPEVAPQGHADTTYDNYVRTLKTTCQDAMPCPPFIQNAPLTCATCTK